MVQDCGRSTLSERVRQERKALLSATPHVDIDRLKFLRQVYQETDGQPPVIRRARLFYRLCSEKDIFIDGNPIVGTLTKYKYGSYPFPEFGSRWLKKQSNFSLQRGKASVTVEEREWLKPSL